MYGKYISCIPPKKCIITAPGADSLLEPFPNIQYANNTPSPGPGLAYNKNIIEDPISFACSIPKGDNIPWFIALFKNNTFAGSINNEVKNIRFLLTKNSTPACNTDVIAITTGPIA